MKVLAIFTSLAVGIAIGVVFAAVSPVVNVEFKKGGITVGEVRIFRPGRELWRVVGHKLTQSKAAFVLVGLGVGASFAVGLVGFHRLGVDPSVPVAIHWIAVLAAVGGSLSAFLVGDYLAASSVGSPYGSLLPHTATRLMLALALIAMIIGAGRVGYRLGKSLEHDQ